MICIDNKYPHSAIERTTQGRTSDALAKLVSLQATVARLVTVGKDGGIER